MKTSQVRQLIPKDSPVDMTGVARQLNPLPPPLMKKTIRNIFAAVLTAALSTASVHAAGTETWVGNTDANWNTAANWTTVGGSTPPANGDSLVFGAAGSVGTALNNDILGLSLFNFDINSGASAFTFGGNGITLNGTLTSAASVNQTFAGGITIGFGAATAIKNTGSGTLALGALSAGSGGTVDFTVTGPITTTTANTDGILGGWATTGNSVSSATTGDWVANDGSGNIVTYTGYTIGTAIAGQPATANFKNTANATVTASTTVNSLVEAADITLSTGVTLTLNSGGLILWGPSKWMKNKGGSQGTGGSEYLASGLSTGEFYVHVPNAGATDYRIWPMIKDGVVATTLIKDGPGYAGLQNFNTYTGGTIVNGGTLALYAGGSSGSVRGTVTVNSGGTLLLRTVDALGYGAGVCVGTLNVNGGTVTNMSGGNEGYLLNINLTGGTVSSSGGNYVFNAGYGNISSMASSVASVIRAPLWFWDTGTFNVTQGTTADGVDLIVSGAIKNSIGVTKTGAGKMIMSGANTYAGATTISEGVLQIGDGISASGSVAGNIDIDVGASLIFANPGAATCAGVISSSSGNPVVKTGAGTLTLSGANTYNVPTIVSNGVVLFATPQFLSGPVTVRDGAAVGVKATTDEVYCSPSSLTLGSSTGANLQFGVFGTTTPVLNPTSLTINGTATINISSAPSAVGATYPLLGNYTGGTLVLGTQPNGYYGKLTVSGTTVSYTVTNLSVDVWTAAVSTNWDTTTANWTNTVGGNLYAANDKVLFDDSASGPSPLLVSVTPSAVAPTSIVVSNVTKSYTIGGLAIGGGSSLTKNGNNTLTLTGTNTFTGALTVSAGALEIAGVGQLGGGNYAANVDVESTLKFNSTAAQTLSGVISGAGALIQAGPSTLILSGANTYSGGATISNGIVGVGNNTGLGTGTLTLNGGIVQNAAGVTMGNDVLVGPSGGTIKLGATSDFGIGGNLSGTGSLILGGASPGINSLNVNFAANTLSGGSITIPLTGNNQTVVRFKSTTSGNAGIPWSIGGAPDRYVTLDFAAGEVIEFGSLSGTGTLACNGAGLHTVQVGALNADSTFAGRFIDNGGTMALNKVGTGKLTLTGANSIMTGAANLSDGILNVGSPNVFSASTPITFAGGMLQYSAGNQADYGSRIANSGSPIWIDLNGTNVTYASAIPNSNYGGLVLTNSTGSGKLTLTADNLYSGDTLINGTTLALSGSGNISGTANIIVSSSGIFDVSAATSYILGGAQTLSGSGTVTGAVTTASSGATISPAGAGTVGALTFKSALTMNSGGSAVFDLSGNHLSGNDQIIVNGNLKLGTSDTIHINAMTGGGNLDETGDYVLFSVTGTLTMSSIPVLVFDNTAPGDAANLLVKASGNNVVLHYSLNPPPTVTSVVVTNVVDGSTVVTRGQSVTVYATVQKTLNNISSVTVDLSPIGGSATQPMTLVTSSGNNYEYTYGPVVVGPSATVGSDSIGVAATDTSSTVGSGAATLTVNASTETWSGLASNDSWGSADNWAGSLAPGYSGDTLFFTGSTRLTPNLEANYDVAGLTFDGSADTFTIGSASGKSLTLSGPLNNSSVNSQTISAPVVLNAGANISDSGAFLTLAGPVSGAGLTVSSGTVVLGGANSYTGDTIVSSGSLKAANSAAIPSGAGKGNVILSSGTTLDVNGTNVSMNGLSDFGTIDNLGLDASTVTIGNGNASSTYGGMIVNSLGPISLVKVGSGSFTIGKNNTYSGDTKILGGSVVLPNGADNAFSGGPLTLSNATLVVQAGGGGSWNSANACYLGNSLVIPSGTTNVIDDSVNNFGNLWVGGDNIQWTGAGTLKFQNNGSVNQPGLIWNGSPLITFNGTIALGSATGTNSSVFNGIAYSSNAGGGTGAAVTTFDSAGTAWNLGEIGYSITQIADAGCTNVKMGSISGSNTNSIMRGSTFEVGALNTSTTFSGKITDGGAGGVSSLTKVGSGSLTLLSLNNTYTGPTKVNSGTLLVNGAITSPVTVNGGTFGGTGSVTGNVTVNSSGALSPGASIGTLTINGNLALSGNTIIELNKSLSPGQSNDFVNVTGTLTCGGTLTVNNLGPALAAGNSFRIFPSGGTGSLTVLGSPGAGLTYSFNDGLLTVVGSGPGTPATLTNNISGNTLNLTWPAGEGWLLQSQTNSLFTGLSTNWGAVTGAADGSYSIIIDRSKPSVFYRLVYP